MTIALRPSTTSLWLKNILIIQVYFVCPAMLKGLHQQKNLQKRLETRWSVIHSNRFQWCPLSRPRYTVTVSVKYSSIYNYEYFHLKTTTLISSVNSSIVSSELWQLNCHSIILDLFQRRHDHSILILDNRFIVCIFTDNAYNIRILCLSYSAKTVQSNWHSYIY